MVKRKTVKEVLFIIIGTSIYAFGLVYLNIANHLAEGSLRDHLDLKSFICIDPAYTTLLINIPLILLGGKILGKRSFGLYCSRYTFFVILFMDLAKGSTRNQFTA